MSAPAGKDINSSNLLRLSAMAESSLQVQNLSVIDDESVSCNSDSRRKALSLKKTVSRKLYSNTKKVTRPSRVFKVEDGLVHEILELENSQLAMTGIKDGVIRIFDYLSGKLKKELYGHSDYVMEMRYIKEKSLLLSYSCDKSIKLWSIKHNFMMVKNIDRPGIVSKIFMMTPALCLLQESSGTSFFKPNNVTQILSLESKSVLHSFDNSKKLGTCLGVLPKSNNIMFSKNGESAVKFFKLKHKAFDLVSEYKPKYNIRDCYELDNTKVRTSSKRFKNLFLLSGILHQTDECLTSCSLGGRNVQRRRSIFSLGLR